MKSFRKVWVEVLKISVPSATFIFGLVMQRFKSGGSALPLIVGAVLVLVIKRLEYSKWFQERVNPEIVTTLKLEIASRFHQNHAHIFERMRRTIGLKKSRQKDESRGAIESSILSAVRELYPDNSFRIGYYKVKRLGQSSSLELVSAEGRSDPHVRVFNDGNRNDQHLFEQMRLNRVHICNDVDDKTVGRNYFSSRRYKSYISVPVLMNTTSVGLLTVDSTEKGVFTITDEDYLRDYANLLGICSRI